MIYTLLAAAALAAAGFQPVTPEADPDAFVLAIVDVETTGLDRLPASPAEIPRRRGRRRPKACKS